MRGSGLRGRTKMSDSNNSGGIGCGGLLVAGLTILFVWMKLTNQIQWERYWVLSPIWISVALYLVLIVGAIILVALFGK